MKMQRIKTVVIATLMLLVLSLSIIFTATGSGHPAPPDQRKVVVTVRIVDAGGNTISGVHISVYQGEQSLGQGESNARGIAQIDVVVNTDKRVILALEVSKPGMETKQHILKLGSNFPMRPPIENIELKPGVSRSEVLVTVKVVDYEGHAIPQAQVNVYKGFRDSTWVVSPSVTQDTTSANGTVTFKLPLRAGEIPDIRLEVSKEDMSDQRRSLNLQAGFPTELPTETFKLMPRAAADSDNMPSAKIKVNVEDEQGNLEGARVAVTSDALTPSQRTAPHERNTGPDGSATVAIELMSVDPVEYIRITVSKPGYKEFKDVMQVNNRWHKAVGKTFDYAKPVTLVKLKGAGSVTVKVRDEDHPNTPVTEALVVLDSKLAAGYYSEPTNASGEVTFEVKESGSFAVRISQDNYEPLKDGEVRLRQGEDSKTVEFLLKAKPKKDMAGDLIEVTVLAKASVDDRQPKPLPGANVSDGRGVSGTTDENGHTARRVRHATTNNRHCERLQAREQTRRCREVAHLERQGQRNFHSGT